MTRFQVGIIILLIFSLRSEAIKCYKCRYQSQAADNSCVGPVNVAHLITCPDHQKYCKVGTVLIPVFRSTTVERECSSTISTQSECTVDALGSKKCLSTCSTDGCNDGPAGSIGHNGTVFNGQNRVVISEALMAIIVVLSAAFVYQ